MNTSINRDAHNGASQVLSCIFAGRAITSATTNGGIQTLTLDNGETVTIRHETTELDCSVGDYVRTENPYTEGFTWRARESFDNEQTILGVWVEMNTTYQAPDDYDEYGDTTETIELWAMFDGDTRPTKITSNETEYTWDIRHPDFTITCGDTTVTARAAHIDAD